MLDEAGYPKSAPRRVATKGAPAEDSRRATRRGRAGCGPRPGRRVPEALIVAAIGAAIRSAPVARRHFARRAGAHRH